MNYETWNQKLCDSFFNASHAGCRVYLYVTPEKLITIAGNDHGLADFITAIRIGPAGFSGSMCDKALAVNKVWRDRSNGLPPYLAFLCFFALAADHQGNWAAHAYYPRLWHLLGSPDAGMPPGFDAMRDLWRDLETWTILDRDGTLGIFKAKIAGRRANVGLPIAQTILTEEERKSLPELFEAADLEPGAVLSSNALAAGIASQSHRLRRRTQQLLNFADGSEYRDELLDVLQNELQEWDGTLPILQNSGESRSPRAGLRIWLSAVDTAGFIKSRLVAVLPDSAEPSDLLLECSTILGRQFECPARVGPCSGALRDVSDRQEFSADQIRWESRIEFQCILTASRLILAASRVRIFVSALHTMHLGGFIESKFIPLSGEFYLAAHESEASFFKDWGRDHCLDWQEITVRSGLPSKWQLFKASSLLRSGTAARRYPIFSSRVAPLFRLEGGIRAGMSARYFPFALPTLSADPARAPESLRFNGILLTPDSHCNYSIPSNLVQPVNIIDAVFQDQVGREVLYVLSDGWAWRNGDDCDASDKFGRKSYDELRIRGADVQGGLVPPFAPDPTSAVENLAVLIGAVPGQITDLRRGMPLPDWPPVWAVSVRRREIIYAFCGNTIDEAMPQARVPNLLVKKWCSFLWTTRKRTTPPRTARLRALLKDYQRSAHAL